MLVGRFECLAVFFVVLFERKIKMANVSKNKSSCRGSNSCSGASRPVSITKRIVNVRRHTVAYMVGGQRMTIAQTRRMARAGNIRNVQVVGNHVQSIPGSRTRRLSDLPVSVER